MKIKIHAYNIVYKDNFKILSITGPNALQNFVNNGYMNCYDSKSAPTELDFDIDFNADPLDNIEELYVESKIRLHEETGLDIKSFKLTFNYI